MRLWSCLCVCALLTHRIAVVSIATDVSSPLRPSGEGTLRLEDQDSSLAKPSLRQETLVEWASRLDEGQADADYSYDSEEHVASVFLVVGVKTSVLHGFANRQAIRQTWASADIKPRDVRVVFLGCEPDLSAFPPREKQQHELELAHEKRVFGDLLTSELRECRDSFATLAAKVKAYYYWADQTHPSAAYAMVTDDDLYLRLDVLVARLRDPATPRERFFGGNSASNAYRGLSLPDRDPKAKYFLSTAQYPMAQLPPFLAGCHFLVSRDLVQFIARNFDDLRDLGALDDTTIGLWLRTLLRVESTYYDDFQILRSTQSCSNHDISLGDLTTEAIRFMHNNIISGRPMCHDFSLLSWAKQIGVLFAPSKDSHADTAAASGNDGDSSVEWDVEHNDTSARLEIAIRIIVGEKVVKFAYIPSLETFDAGFCRRANAQLQQKLFVTVGIEWCVSQRHALLDSLNKTAIKEPGLRALVDLTRHNLLRSVAEDANWLKGIVNPPPFVVVLSQGVHCARVLIESLFVELNPESSVRVVHEDETPLNTLVDVYVTAETALDTVRYRSKHVLVLESEHVAWQEGIEADSRVFVLSTGSDSIVSAMRVPVSMASQPFSHTIRYSPADLLRPGVTTDPSRAIKKRFGAFVSTSSQSVSWLRRHLVEQLGDISLADLPNRCRQATTYTTPRFCLDTSVEGLTQVKFAFVQDASAMVIALLAGCIPVYIGPSTTRSQVLRLFNPRAFLDCSLLESLDECARLVVSANASVRIIEQLQMEPGIVDSEAFADHFFWHPIAGDMHSNTAARKHRDRRLHNLRQWIKT